ncbi:MAG: hypothetical protein Q9208_004926 [Pyrenodesmia sp. 3 TL-2023]
MYVKNILSAMTFASAAAATALTVTATTQNTAFDAMANTNMAVYWGQGPSQPRLAHFCEDSNIDIIPIGFLNIFPDQVNGGYPGTNFGNQCGSETYENGDGSWSPLLSNCPFIGPDIKTCQAMGKKILLSLGGAIPTNQSIDNDDTAKSFARFLWHAFGPEHATYAGPRPFGDAVVDGFDFDIESDISDNDATTQYRGYGTMIDVLRAYFAMDARKEYYISGSPQCVIPDAHLAHPIETSWFDFLLIQFYNTPQCSARAHFDASYGQQGDTPSAISFDSWVTFVRNQAMNKDVKLYIGLPAAPLTQLTYDTYMYIAPHDVADLIDVFQCRYPKEFGGIMVWEATYSEQNQIEGKPYVDLNISDTFLIHNVFICCRLNNRILNGNYLVPGLILYSNAICLRLSANFPEQHGYLECDHLHTRPERWYRLIIDAARKQHRYLDRNYVHAHSNCWNWFVFNAVPKQHWPLEQHLKCTRRNRLVLHPTISYKHGCLEFDFSSRPNGHKPYQLVCPSQYIHFIDWH